MVEAQQTRTGTDTQDFPKSVNIVNPIAGEPGASETRPSAGATLSGEILVAVPTSDPVLQSTPPASAHDFVSRVKGIPGVKCVIIEEVEGGVMQCMTYLETASEEARSAVYKVELAVTREHPTELFDFHVRFADEVGTGGPERIAGAHYFAVWGSLDAGSR